MSAEGQALFALLRAEALRVVLAEVANLVCDRLVLKPALLAHRRALAVLFFCASGCLESGELGFQLNSRRGAGLARSRWLLPMGSCHGCCRTVSTARPCELPCVGAQAAALWMVPERENSALLDSRIYTLSAESGVEFEQIRFLPFPVLNVSLFGIPHLHVRG